MNETTKTMTKTQKEKPRYNMWQNSGFMIREAWRNRKSVLTLCVATVVLAVGTSLAQLFVAPVILQKVEQAVPLRELLMTIAAFTGTLLVLAALSEYVLQNTIFGRIEVRSHLVAQIHTKFTTTSFPHTEDPSFLKKLEKASRATGGNSEATEAIWETLTKFGTNAIGFIIYLFLLSSLHPVLLAVILVTTIISYLASKQINKWGYLHREEEAAYSKKMDYVSTKAEEPTLAKDIRIFGMRSWLDDIYQKTLHLYESFLARREKRYLWANVIDIVLTILRNAIAYFYLIHLTLDQNLPASQFLLYFSAVSGFTTWVTGILNELGTLHTQSLDICTLREFLETPDLFTFSGGKPIPTPVNGTYTIEVKHVSLRYPGAESDTLHDINLTLHAGENLAIVGLNGAGKTSLVKIICGFYDPTEGEVLLNGINIKEFNRQEYYQLFSAVFQQFSLLATTIEENVSQSYNDTDSCRVKECLALAGLTEKVNSLPQKEKTHLTKAVHLDGIELSGGQTQRLMLARALYKDAPILVLDEPTAALDPIAENDIYLKYNEMTKGRTSLFISHRLASTRFCDRIIFLADGTIAEDGTHDSLMEMGGAYANLFDVQSKYYQEGVTYNGEE